MTTIITKNGSGAPAAGQLSQGELAVDLTNKELYTKDSGGNVIKVGAQGGSTGTFTDLTATSSFTSPGIDDNATSTAITIDANENVGIGTAPSFPLDVAGTNTTILRATNSTATGTFRVFHEGALVSLGSVGGSNNELAFKTGGTTGTEAMRIDAAGNVGIGTSDPSAGTSSYYDDLVIKNATASSGAGITIQSNSTNGFGGLEFRRADGTQVGKVFADSSTGSLGIETAGASRVNITSVGNVGIGTSDPSSSYVVKFAHVEDSTSAGYLCENSTSKWATYVNTSGGYDIRNETTGNLGMRVDSNGSVGIGTATPLALFQARGEDTLTASTGYRKGWIGGAGSWGANSYEELSVGYNGIRSVFAGNNEWELAFTTGTSTGFTSGQQPERMRIDSSGNLLVGCTTTPSSAVPGTRISDNGVTASRFAGATTNPTHIIFYTSTAQAGSISSNGSITSYTTSSDERLKENIVDAPAGNIDSIKVRSFDWKIDGEHQEYGFIAQELETVAPYAVSKGETDEDMMSVDYSKLVPMLVKEIQDLKAEVAALKGA